MNGTEEAPPGSPSSPRPESSAGPTSSAGVVARSHAVAIGFAGAIAVLLLAPFPTGPGPLFPGFTFALPLDKVVHFLLFLVAARPWWRSFATLGGSSPRVATLLFAVAYAGLLELAQESLTRTRTAEWGDLAAGALGALAGVLSLGRARSASAATEPGR